MDGRDSDRSDSAETDASLPACTDDGAAEGSQSCAPSATLPAPCPYRESDPTPGGASATVVYDNPDQTI
jgi:hypothetical protein